MPTKEVKIMRDDYFDHRRCMNVRAETAENGDLIVVGRPVIFNQEYELFRYGGKPVMEVIEAGAFDNTDMADVPLKYNHGDNKGTPARTTSKTERGHLWLTKTETGIEMKANLLPTSGGKDLFMEIEAGTVSQMSWAFTEVKDSGTIEELEDRIVFHVKQVQRVFDVSAVDFGANSNTTIYARRLGELDERTRELTDRQLLAEQKQKIKNKIGEYLK